MNAAMSSGARRKVTLERTFKASIEEVWDLWATQEGIESWWGPDGFAVTVHKLDLRPGGELVYAMTAVASDQIEFMKKAGMPLTTESRVTYTDVIPPRRLAYTALADFIRGVAPYVNAICVRIARASALSGRSSSATIEKWLRPAASTTSTDAPSARHAVARSSVWRWYSGPSSAPTARMSGARLGGFKCTGLLRRAVSGDSPRTSLR